MNHYWILLQCFDDVHFEYEIVNYLHLKMKRIEMRDEMMYFIFAYQDKLVDNKDNVRFYLFSYQIKWDVLRNSILWLEEFLI